MGRTSAVSAGLVLFRAGPRGLEIFLAHPGGPFWARRDAGAWTIPKGVRRGGRGPARRRRSASSARRPAWSPAAPSCPLGSVRQKSGKRVHAWAWRGDADPATVTSNHMKIEWPRGSGPRQSYPEVDRCAWFTPAEAREKINAAQSELSTA